jgi:hypothetical protein
MFLSVLIIKKLFPLEDRKGLISVTFIGLFLTHPYTIANTTLPDIDQTLLPLVMAIFIFYLINFLMPLNQGENKKIKYFHAVIFLSIIFCLNLWVKLTTSISLLPLTFFTMLCFGESIFKSIKTAAFIGLLGLAFFLPSYAIYCSVAKLPMSYTFDFLLHSFTKGTIGTTAPLFDKILSNISYVKSFSLWMTVPFLTLYLVSIFHISFKLNKTIAEKIVMTLSIFGFSVSLFYLSLIGPFGGFFKYPFPVFFTFFIPISYFIYDCLLTKICQSDNRAFINQPLLFFIIFIPAVFCQALIF